MSPEEVKALRTRLGLSQEAMARALGVSLQTVNRWEKGRTAPSQLANRALRDLEREVGHAD